MSRRDTIIVAVLINTGLLTLLFATAMNSDDDQNFIKQEMVRPRQEKKLIAPQPIQTTAVDEVDQAIAAYKKEEQKKVEPIKVQAKSEPKPVAPKMITVKVKEGDNLERIARANGTTVQAIMKANQLTTFTVQIGQSLKIPLRPDAPQDRGVHEFYIVKNGDNPWVISRRTGVDFEEILRLNGLNERKARKLQPGDKLRIR